MQVENFSTLGKWVFVSILQACIVSSDFQACHPSVRVQKTSPDGTFGTCARIHASLIRHALDDARYTSINVAIILDTANKGNGQFNDLLEVLMDFWWNASRNDLPLSKAQINELWILVRFFLFGQHMPSEKLQAFLGRDTMDALDRCGMITRCISKPSIVTALVSLFPLPDTPLVIATDWESYIAGRKEQPVMSIGRDSIGLLRNMPKPHGLHVLDLCAGSGVQGFTAFARGAESVTLVDINPRALRFMRFNMMLNFDDAHRNKITIIESDLRNLSLGTTFDTILANPPFVATVPSGEDGLLFETGGPDGEDVIRRVLHIATLSLKADGQFAIVTFLYNPDVFHEHACKEKGRKKRPGLGLRGFSGSVVYDPGTVLSGEDAARVRQKARLGSYEGLDRHYEKVGIKSMAEGFLFGWRNNITRVGTCHFEFRSTYKPMFNLPVEEQSKAISDRPCAWSKHGGSSCDDFKQVILRDVTKRSGRSEL